MPVGDLRSIYSWVLTDELLENDYDVDMLMLKEQSWPRLIYTDLRLEGLARLLRNMDEAIELWTTLHEL